MKLVRQSLDVTSDLGAVLPDLPHAVRLSQRAVRLSHRVLDFEQENRKSLADIIMKLACDPAAFSFLGLDEFAAQLIERLLCEALLRTIEAGTWVARKRPDDIKSRHSDIQDPAIFSVMPPEPILHPELLTPIECLGVGIQARL